jgi:hypothetical protein
MLFAGGAREAPTRQAPTGLGTSVNHEGHKKQGVTLLAFNVAMLGTDLFTSEKSLQEP